LVYTTLSVIITIKIYKFEGSDLCTHTHTHTHIWTGLYNFLYSQIIIILNLVFNHIRKSVTSLSINNEHVDVLNKKY